MSTLNPTVVLGRTLLLLGGGTCALLMVGPFQGLEKAWVPWDKAAHFILFYGVTVLLYLSFPSRRRLDLTLLAIFTGCALEGLQRFSGRDAGLGDMAANALGALAVLAPMYVEDLRMAARGASARGRRGSTLLRGLVRRLAAAAPRSAPATAAAPGQTEAS